MITTVDVPVSVVEISTGRGWVYGEINGGAAGILVVPSPPAVLVDVTHSGDGVVHVVTPGPSGPQGTTGSTGQTGATGPSPIFEQTFAVATMQWVINHTLNEHPVVTTVDTNGDEIIGDVSFPDNATVIIDFGMPVAGVARLKG